ncbi:hypothetical protein E4M02_08780 [Brevundimonas sp. S30B]|uniref:hypothetical protein n=1 Tax=unclassified Brevundimonas TaxID=2622653 RepID=UPI0010724732|nr:MULTISPECIES: hypothetical protein [unclassified Brevundimonas]QBX38450.1 hypothetical protein E4M01_12215 [Brevundimonas sp. MF30-B]TFW02159.1 hypothetical protein E4M02_08780 [Brevundimonas sp. S30B]
MSIAFSEEEIAVYRRLTRDAGVVFKRLVILQGVREVADLEAATARTLFRQAWRTAAAEYFDGQDISDLNVEIDRVIDHLIADLPLPVITASDLN